jgi:hypothetical protein
MRGGKERDEGVEKGKGLEGERRGREGKGRGEGWEAREGKCRERGEEGKGEEGRGGSERRKVGWGSIASCSQGGRRHCADSSLSYTHYKVRALKVLITLSQHVVNVHMRLA